MTEAPFVERHLSATPVERLAAVQGERAKLASARNGRRSAASVGSRPHRWPTALRRPHGLSPQAVIFEFTSGAAAALDEYSGFLTGGQMDEVFSQIEGNFVGLGVELKTEPAGLLIVNVISSGPGYQGGIRPGDRIVAVDGKTTADVSPDAMADLLRGRRAAWSMSSSGIAAGKRAATAADAAARRSAQRRSGEDRR